MADQITRAGPALIRLPECRRIQKHHAPPSSNPPIAIVQPIDRRIELIVTAHRHHQELAGLQIMPRQIMNGKLRASTGVLKTPLPRGVRQIESAGLRARAGCNHRIPARRVRSDRESRS